MQVPRPSFKIRKAISGDSAAILSCLRSAFVPYQTRYTPAAFEDTVLNPQTLAERMNSMFIFVAIDGAGSICGTIGCNPTGNNEGHLRGMAVLPEQQGTGLAEALLERAESQLLECGCSRVTLDTTAPLERAISFYERRGYRATGRVTDFFGMPLYEYAKTLS